MFAYAPDGTPIQATKEVANPWCNITQGTFRRDKDGTVSGDHDQGTTNDYDGQQTVEVAGEMIFIDDDGDEWPACALVLLDEPKDDETGLPQDLVDAANAALDAWQAEQDRKRDARSYRIDKPSAGWRDVKTFTPEEKARLRPIAETLAILDGNAFFGLVTDKHGDDVHYEQYLPEAFALLDANGGWGLRASFLKGDDTPTVADLGIAPVREWEGRRVVDLVDSPDVIIEIVGIDWDTSSDDDEDLPDGMKPALPETLLAGVPADWGDDNSFVDLLSDRYGYCINGVTGSTTQVAVIEKA